MTFRTLCSIALFVLGMQPNTSFSLSDVDSRHFLLRTGEDLNMENMALLSKKTREEAFQWLLRNHAKASAEPFVTKWLPKYEDFYATFQKYPENKDSRSFRVELAKKGRILEEALAQENFGSKKLKFDADKPQSFDIDVHKIVDITGHILNILWLDRFIGTESPFTETMTLFWHSHFTTSFNKVNRPALILRQNELFRTRSLGSFSDLLEKITLDGAMLVYLDGSENVKGKPNYNFARELLELFTLGEGNYSEADVREVARALTGLRLYQNEGSFDPAFHDDSEKVIIGARGHFNYKHVLSLLLRNEKTSEFIVQKFWQGFISPTPNEKIVKAWAKDFRESSYDIKKLVRRILTSDEFYAAESRHTLVKSPVEFVTSFFRIFRYRPENYMRVVHQSRVLGQTLYRPPDVRGWLGGTEWITLSTWLVRQRHVKNLFLLNGEEYTREKDTIDFSPFSNRISDALIEQWKKQFVKTDWKTTGSFLFTGRASILPSTASDREILTTLLITPEFNLK